MLTVNHYSIDFTLLWRQELRKKWWGDGGGDSGGGGRGDGGREDGDDGGVEAGVMVRVAVEVDGGWGRQGQ